MNYFRLNPTPEYDEQLCDAYGLVKRGAIYRSSAVFSIWRKNVLIDILREGENAWDFEIKGSERTNIYEGWYAASRWNMKYYNLVIKGLYDLRVYKKLSSEGLIFSSDRKLMNYWQLFKRVLQEYRSELFFYVVPSVLRRKIRMYFSN